MKKSIMASNSKTIKVVVTGGAGFIGSHIADECVNRGWQVTILDNLSTGRKENIKHLLGIQYLVSPNVTGNCELETGNSQVDFIQGSITDLPLLQKIFSGVDYIFHEAAIPSVPRSIDNPMSSHEANVTGTLNVLIAARDNMVKKVVFASSSSVYGDTATLPEKEDMTPDPQSPYAVNKMAAEHYCVVFNKVYGLPTACLRYFNVYGPRQNPDSQYAAVIPKFIQSITAGKSPVIFGDGEQSRDFTFVKDVVAANIQAAESQANGVFNIGRGEKITLNQLTQMILKILNRPEIKPEYEKTRAGDVKHSLADISRARSFGYNPQYNIEKGVIETIKSFGNNLLKGA
ncbi:MAG: SDR family oxidoreductase [Chloroflexi bacterium]|nr:SDR family oxidoreductase [Chloroflexota bacterium]